jgi:hypothetical protein
MATHLNAALAALAAYRTVSAENNEEVMKDDMHTCTIWSFPWDITISTEGQQVFLRDIVKTDEFLLTVEEEESRKAMRFCIIHPLERYTKVDSSGAIVQDIAVLNATYSRDGPCEDCGEYTKNGRMTCLCWTDEEDIARMDRDIALHR